MPRPVRTAVFLVVVAAAIGLGIRASYLNLQRRPEFGPSVAFGVAVLLLNLFVFRPALRPRRPPAVTVTDPDAAPGARRSNPWRRSRGLTARAPVAPRPVPA